MMSSDIESKARAILAKVFVLMREPYIQQTVCDPIEQAALCFTWQAPDPLSWAAFIAVTGEFAGHIVKSVAGEALNVHQARAKAISFLERGYTGQFARGFHAAFLDAKLHDGIETVLSNLTEIFTAEARKDHARWVFSTRIDCLDWKLRCAISQILLKRYQSFLPPALAACPPSQLAGFIPDMIQAIIGSDQMVSNILFAEFA